VAVQAFLDKQLNFGDIPGVIDRVMNDAPGGSLNDLDEVFAADTAARERSRAVLCLLRDGVRSIPA
jgi:1-deoxy-D-xylulose 5-phosphate reductoisomerase